MDANLKCPMCGGQFNSQQEMDEHAQKMHSKQSEEGQQEHSMTCTKCGLKSKSMQDLEEHKKDHQVGGQQM